MRERFVLLVMIGAIAFPAWLTGCALPVKPAPALPPPSPQPVLSPASSIPPHTVINEGPAGIINYNSFTFKWSAADDQTPADKVTYSTFLEGYDSDWSAFAAETTRQFGRVPNGAYTFYVKAQDDSGNMEPEPVSQKFTISGVSPKQPPPVSVPGMGGFLLVGSDVSRVVVAGDGSTLYALDSLNSKLYRSDSSGLGWVDLSGKVSGGPPWLDVSVAPDNPALVAVLTDGGRGAYISDDAGVSFSSTQFSAAIGAGQAGTCIAVSPDYGSPKRDLVIGTWTGAGGGHVYLNMLSRFSSGWLDISAGSPGWAPADITAIEFSPSYAADGTLLCVASTPARSYLYLAMRDLGSRNNTWNAAAGYPVELCNPGAGTPGTPLFYSDISLPADYNGSSANSRHAFVSWSKNHPSEDVYHVVDNRAFRMGAPEPIASIAYWGTISHGKLLAGAVRAKPGCNCAFVQTYFTANPMGLCSSCPGWQPSQKAPTGQYNARVAWSLNGGMAYAGTTGIESAISHSINNGSTWNQ